MLPCTVFALKQMVISISGLYLSSIRSMLFRLIRLNLVSGLTFLYSLIITLGTIVSARVGRCPNIYEIQGPRFICIGNVVKVF